MKKLKFLPSVLMLAMCIAVLCVGIYAASPTSNTVKGSITVTSMARIKITGYINDEEVFASKNTASGVEWDLTNSSLLKFDAFNASDESELPQKIIRLRIENLSTMPLGAYFYSGEGLVKDGDDEYASYESLQHSMEIYPVGLANGEKNSDTKLADVTLSTYTYIASNDKATGGYDEIDMYITIDITNLFYEEYQGEFEFNLRIENYKSGSLGTSKKLTKLANPTEPDDGTTNVYSIPNQTDTNVGVFVVPTTYTKVTATSISGLKGLEHLILPTSITSMADGCLANCWELCSLDLPMCGGAVSCGGKDTIDNWTIYPIANFFATAEPQVDHSSFKYMAGYKYDQEMGIFSSIYNNRYISSKLKTIYLNMKTIQSGALECRGGTFELNNLIIGQNVSRIIGSFDGDIATGNLMGGAVSCVGVSCILIPQKVSLGPASFLDDTDIINLIFSGQHFLDQGALKGCSALQNIYGVVTYIMARSLEGCSSLKQFTFPANWNDSMEGWFDDCVAMKTITIESDYVYNAVTSDSAMGCALMHATTVKVLASIIDGGATNSYLGDTTKYTMSATAVDGYYVFTKVA